MKHINLIYLIIILLLSCDDNDNVVLENCSADYSTSNILTNIDEEIFNNDESVQSYSIFSWMENDDYRILNGIVKYLNPKLVVEIGTYTGMGTFALSQNLSGAIITKLDGSSRGGVSLAVSAEVNLPIRFIGAGEGIKDLRPFNSFEFVEALLADR